MAGFAVELVVRFAGTLLAVTRVRPTERFLIGTARNVDLPIAAGGMTAFPLVDLGSVVRVPVGVDATYDGARTELAFGLVTITITKVRDARVELARPPVQKRLVPYAIGALLAHLAVVIVALAVASDEPILVPVVRAEPPKRVLARLLPVPPPKPKKQKQKPAKQAAAASEPVHEVAQAPGTVAHAREQARGAGVLGSASLDDLSMIIGKKNLAQELADVGPIYDEDAANAQNFGGSGGAFRPEDDRAFDSVKTGRYATNGNAGANYRLPAHGKFREVERPPVMGLTCDDGTCKTVGSLDRFTVRDHVEKRYVDMVKCFERNARSVSRIELTLHFDIREDGTASEVYAEGASAFGRCIVGLVERTKFPAEKPTQVTYPIAFWRT